VERYQFHFSFDVGPDTYEAMAECAPSAWRDGEGITVVTMLPPRVTLHEAWNLRIMVDRQTHTWYRPRLGSLTFETAKEILTEPVTLPLGTQPTPGLANPDSAGYASATISLASRRIARPDGNRDAPARGWQPDY
jgi:hypothetical protein